jgi:hypothetical protein
MSRSGGWVRATRAASLGSGVIVAKGLRLPADDELVARKPGLFEPAPDDYPPSTRLICVQTHLYTLRTRTKTVEEGSQWPADSAVAQANPDYFLPSSWPGVAISAARRYRRTQAS